jgi:hypothetical protein
MKQKTKNGCTIIDKRDKGRGILVKFKPRNPLGIIYYEEFINEFIVCINSNLFNSGSLLTIKEGSDRLLRDFEFCTEYLNKNPQL